MKQLKLGSISSRRTRDKEDAWKLLAEIIDENLNEIGFAMIQRHERNNTCEDGGETMNHAAKVVEANSQGLHEHRER